MTIRTAVTLPARTATLLLGLMGCTIALLPNPCLADKPSRVETITPLHKDSFNNDGKCREREQGGNPRTVGDVLVFDGSQDGDRQVDPQIAVGGGFVLHGTNTGLVVYRNSGEYVQGVSQNCFNGGIDPKLFYSSHNQVFGFDLWNPWDKEKLKPVNISISETNDPTGAWNTYPVPAPGGVDGGGIGYSRRWIGYSFPGGNDRTFVLPMEDCKAGRPAKAFHFAGSLGHPVQMQDATDDLYFVELRQKRLRINKVFADDNGEPQSELVADVEHGLKYVGYPPQSPQQGSDKKSSSGDRNPKNLVVQGGFLWFSHTVNCEGRAAVQWHQVKLDGTFVQSGLISDPKRNFIQTTIAVNQQLDVLVGFQEAGDDMFISPRFAYRLATDEPNQLRATISLGEGRAATLGGPWGDYSGSVVDGDNGLDLWTIQSIADAEGKGDTVIAKLPIAAR